MNQFFIMVSKNLGMKSALTSWLFFFYFLLSACSSRPPSIPAPEAIPTKGVEVVNIIEPTETPLAPALPTLTPEPQPDQAVFLTPPGSDPQLVDEIRNLLEEVLRDYDIDLLVAPALSREDLGEHVRLVAALAPAEGLTELAIAHPETQFVAIGINGLEPQDNLSLVVSENQGLGQQAFMAGVIGAIITPDWRIGVITTGDPAGQAASQAFVNGGVYFCGLCRQVYPPFFDAQGTYIKFPLQFTVVDADWQSAAQFMIDREVKTIYLPPEAANPELLDTLVQAGVNIIGSSGLESSHRENWIATLSFSPIEPLRQMLPGLIQGDGGSQIAVNLTIEDANPDLFSPARQNLARSILEELSSGFISTGVE